MKSFASATWNVGPSQSEGPESAVTRNQTIVLGASLGLHVRYRRTRALPSLCLVFCLLLGSAGQAFSSSDLRRSTSSDSNLLLARHSTAAMSQWSPAKLRSAASSRKTDSELVAPRRTSSTSFRGLHFLSVAYREHYISNDVSLGFGRSPPCSRAE
jgi:hypothetical protein